MSDSLNWEFYKLSELATFRRGSFPQPYGLDKWYDDENGFPFVQVFDVGDNMRLKNTTKRRISSLAGDQSVFVEKGTIILTIQGSIGRVAITHYDTYIDRTLLIFQSFKLPTDKKFFMYVVHRLFEDEKKRAHGSTIATITKEQLSSFVIPLPPLQEQQKIAEILSTVDAKIDLIDQQITETQALKKGLMQRLLTKGIGHTVFKDSVLGKIPKSWEKLKMENLGEIVSGGTPKTDSPNFWNGNIHWMTPTDVTALKGKRYIYITKRNITEEGLKNSSANILPIGTLIVCTRATIGDSVINKVPISTNQGFKSLITNSEVSSEFMYYWMTFNKNELLKQSSGSTFLELSTKSFKNLDVQLPPLNEQKKIAEILSSVDDKLEVLSEKKTYYQELKQGLMQQLLTGKIRVNNLIAQI